MFRTFLNLRIGCFRLFVIAILSTPVTVSRISNNIDTNPFPYGKRWLLFLRCSLGTVNLMINFYSLQVFSQFLIKNQKIANVQVFPKFLRGFEIDHTAGDSQFRTFATL